MALEQGSTSEDVVIKCEYDIEEDVEAQLEEYVRLNHICEFQNANDLFRRCLKPYLDWYPVAAEQADCLLRQGRFSELRSRVSKVLSSGEYNPEEVAVLKFLRAIAKGYDDKDPLGLVYEANAIWNELASCQQSTHCAATEVHLWELVLHAAVLTSSISTRRIAKMNVDVSERTHRAFFVAWFKGLLTKRALWEAQCILQSLLYVLPWEESNSLISLFMDAAEAIGFTTEPVQAAVSSLVQRLVFAVSTKKGLGSLGVDPWNESTTHALFGVESDLRTYCLRQSLEKLLTSHIQLPTSSLSYVDDLRHDIIEAAKSSKLSFHYHSFQARCSSKLWSDVVAMALHKATEENQTTEVFNQLLQHTSVDARDLYQRTALHIASMNGHGMAVEYLINHRADVMCFDWFDYTPMHYVAQLNDQTEALELAKMILSSGRFKWTTFRNVSPLHIAIQMKHRRLISMFVTNGAQDGSVDRIGRTALQLAEEWEDRSTIRLLRAEGDIGLDRQRQELPLELDYLLAETESPLKEAILNVQRLGKVRASAGKDDQAQWKINEHTSVLPSQLNEILCTRDSAKLFLIDTRMAYDFLIARISGALLLWRFDLWERAEPARMYRARTIIVYDSSERETEGQDLSVAFLRRFTRAGWSGFFGFLKGGFDVFAKEFPEQVEWVPENTEESRSTGTQEYSASKTKGKFVLPTASEYSDLVPPNLSESRRSPSRNTSKLPDRSISLEDSSTS